MAGLVNYELEIQDLTGAAISSANVGDKFRIQAFVQDGRDPAIAQGVAQASLDLGVLHPELVNFSPPAGFASGIVFDPLFAAGRQAFEGGGIQVNGNTQALVNDGEVFTIRVLPNQTDYEFDWDGVVSAGNVAVSLRAPTPGAPLTPQEVHAALLSSLSSSQLGLMPSDNGANVIGLGNPNAEFLAGTSQLTVSEVSDELFNELSASATNQPTTPPQNSVPFFSIEFEALTGGVVTFVPSRTEQPAAIHRLFGVTNPVADNDIMFGSAVSLTITDTGLLDAIDDQVSLLEDSSQLLAGGAVDLAANDIGQRPPLSIVSVDPIPGVTRGSLSGSNYTPPANYFGPDSVSYTLSDSFGLLDTATVSLSIAGVNDAPVPGLDSFSTPLNQALTIPVTSVLSNDAPGPPNESNQLLSVSGVSVSSNTQGQIALVADQIIFQPTPGFAGNTSFLYDVEDDGPSTGSNVNAATGTVSVLVAALNEPPILIDDQISSDEDQSVSVPIQSLLQNDSPGIGEDGFQQLSFGNFTPVGTGGTITRVADALVFVPDPDFNGSFVFSYTAEDNGSPTMTATAAATISVAAVNDPPIATDDFITGSEDQTLSTPIASLTSNDLPGPPTATDETNQLLGIITVSPLTAMGGSVSLNSNSIDYIPPADYFGPDSYTYTLADDLAATVVATVSIDVSAVNDPPVVGPVAGKTFGTSQNQSLSIPIADILSGDSPGPANETSQSLQITQVSATANTNGQVQLNLGQVSYTPDPTFSGTASFSYTVRDDGGGNDTSTGTVQVNVAQCFSEISGSVFHDANGDGIRQPNEPGLAQSEVFVDSDLNGEFSPGERVEFTNSAGNYLFDNVIAGSYRILSRPDPRFAQTTDDGTPFVVPICQSISNSPIGKFELATLSGRVFGDKTANGVLDGEDDLKWYWPVELLDQDGQPVQDAFGETVGTPEHDGSYTFRSLLPSGATIRTPGGGLRSAPTAYILKPEIQEGYELTTNLDRLFTDGQFYETGSLGGNIATGDINLDGLIDLVVANDLASQADGTSSITLLLNSPSNPGRFSATSIALENDARPHTIKLEDVDRDDDLDILVALIGSPAADKAVNRHGIYLIPNDDGQFEFSNGRYLVDSRSPDPSPELVQIEFAGSDEPRFLSSFDALRSDGPTDFAYTAFENGDPPSLVVTHLRSDNILIDDLSGNQQYLQVGGDPLVVEAGDLDGDQIPDLVFAHFDGFIDFVLSSTEEAFTIDVGEQGPTDIVLHDIDRDRDLDIVTNNWQTGSVFVLALDGGEPDSVQELKNPLGTGTNSLAIANINGTNDRRFPDIIVSNESSGSSVIWINQQGNGFSDPQVISFPAALPDPNPFMLGVGYSIAPQEAIATDLNDDGLSDYVLANRIAGVSVHLNSGGAISIDDLVVADPRLFDFGFSAIDIVGQKWDDANQNGRIDPGEMPLGGTTIFADANSDGVRSPAEIFTTTNAFGFYSLPVHNAGLVQLREELPPDAQQTFPGFDNHFRHSLLLTEDSAANAAMTNGLNFGNAFLGRDGEGELTNPNNQFDVNNDGYVTAVDALLVINALNRPGDDAHFAEGEGTDSTIYWDVAPDRVLSPLDALLVINRLNVTAEAEAEHPDALYASDPEMLTFSQDLLEDICRNRLARTKMFNGRN